MLGNFKIIWPETNMDYSHQTPPHIYLKNNQSMDMAIWGEWCIFA